MTGITLLRDVHHGLGPKCSAETVLFEGGHLRSNSQSGAVAKGSRSDAAAG
jgi:hypothetical protein